MEHAPVCDGVGFPEGHQKRQIVFDQRLEALRTLSTLVRNKKDVNRGEQARPSEDEGTLLDHSRLISGREVMADVSRRSGELPPGAAKAREEHPGINKIRNLVLAPESVPLEQRVEIDNHLAHCAHCLKQADLYRERAEYYRLRETVED